jgi:hypothetical protein
MNTNDYIVVSLEAYTPDEMREASKNSFLVYADAVEELIAELRAQRKRIMESAVISSASSNPGMHR